MNSEEPQAPVINKSEVEDTISYIDNQLSNIKETSKELKTTEEIDEQVASVDGLTKLALEQFSKLDKNTDDLYQLFYTPIALRQDRSDASKVALLDSQRLKVEMIQALTGLITAKNKLEAAKQKTTSNMGVFVNAVPGNDVGISLHNLWEGTKEE
jgi:hypothetical protein